MDVVCLRHESLLLLGYSFLFLLCDPLFVVVMYVVVAVDAKEKGGLLQHYLYTYCAFHLLSSAFLPIVNSDVQ